jgi:hypothetical protein
LGRRNILCPFLACCGVILPAVLRVNHRQGSRATRSRDSPLTRKASPATRHLVNHRGTVIRQGSLATRRRAGPLGTVIRCKVSPTTNHPASRHLRLRVLALLPEGLHDVSASASGTPSFSLSVESFSSPSYPTLSPLARPRSPPPLSALKLRPRHHQNRLRRHPRSRSQYQPPRQPAGNGVWHRAIFTCGWSSQEKQRWRSNSAANGGGTTAPASA